MWWDSQCPYLALDCDGDREPEGGIKGYEALTFAQTQPWLLRNLSPLFWECLLLGVGRHSSSSCCELASSASHALDDGQHTEQLPL